jgi:hypothetical protein
MRRLAEIIPIVTVDVISDARCPWRRHSKFTKVNGKSMRVKGDLWPKIIARWPKSYAIDLGRL